MGVLETIQNGFSNITNAIENNPLASTAIAGGAGVALGATTAGIIATKVTKRKKKSKKTKKKSSKRKSKGRKLKFGSKAYRKKYLGKKRKHKQRKPHTAGKRKDRSTKRIRYTKNNQPYIILPSGKAKFISKASARRSRRTKGGRY